MPVGEMTSLTTLVKFPDTRPLTRSVPDSRPFIRSPISPRSKGAGAGTGAATATATKARAKRAETGCILVKEGKCDENVKEEVNEGCGVRPEEESLKN